MDKYTLLFLLNFPFVLFGLLKAVMVYRTHTSSRFSFILRISFWLFVLAGLVFAENVYEYLSTRGLTDSTPLSLADVVLTTGLVASLSLTIRLYAKNDLLEKRVADLHEKLSVITSTTKH